MRRWAAPVGLVILVTVAVLLVHNGLSTGDTTTSGQTVTRPPAPTTTATPSKRRPRRPTAPANAEYYLVQSGDTFGSIAARYGKTVTEIEALNPGVSSTSLTVGQRIRVK